MQIERKMPRIAGHLAKSTFNLNGLDDFSTN
jgi:hypothetical protein